MEDLPSGFWIAVLLTVMDLAVVQPFTSASWLAWAGIEWVRWTLTLLLVVWTAAAALIWLHVFYDFRSLLSESRLPILQNRSRSLRERRFSDV